MNTIFEKDFFPTPVEVIELMMQEHDCSGKVILEPSAGSGNIVEWLQQNYANEVIACEQNVKLRSIVETKCRIIADDFLTVTPEMVSHIDMIVMNPPFSNARKHILHAYEIAPNGTEIVALCNSSDMNGRAYSTTDQLKVQELVENYGHHEDLGRCFISAERKTDVQISCIHLYKPKSGQAEFEDYLFSSEEEGIFTNGQPGLMQYDLIRDVVMRYIDAVQRFDAVNEASNEINNIISLFNNGKEFSFGAFQQTGSGMQRINRLNFKKGLQHAAWKFLINKLNLQRFATSQLYKQINRFIETQIHVPFTMKNVYRMLNIIVSTTESRMNIALEEAFDNICSFSADNSTAGEKWKTNSNYMLNRKFIVPNLCQSWSCNPNRVYNTIYHNSRQKMEDVFTVLEYLTGKHFATNIFEVINKENLEFGKWYEHGYFKFKAFRKGTIHFQFLDDNVWALFNQRVASIRGWQIGSCHKKKRCA